VAVFYNNGSGGFSEQVLEWTGGQNNVAMDVDGDGDRDILNVNHGFYGAPHPIELFINNLNNGAPPPPPPPPPSGQSPWGGNPAAIPARSRRRTSTWAAKGWPITTWKARTRAGSTARATASTSERARPRAAAAMPSAGARPASGSSTRST
jgi:hypothetical protein